MNDDDLSALNRDQLLTRLEDALALIDVMAVSIRVLRENASHMADEIKRLRRELDEVRAGKRGEND